jgi:hypothetical protein
MRRVLVLAFIALYLGALAYGNLCYALGHGTGSHPLMYFIVWDMFCGWSAYDSRTHIIARGESQKYYELAPAPWGEIHPWGSLGRRHYDGFNTHTGRIALNTLRHAAHEPIERIFVIEECWAKRFNLPDAVWASRYDGPRDVTKYHRLRSELLADGTPVKRQSAWLAHQSLLTVWENPRLQQDAELSRSLFLREGELPGEDATPSPGEMDNPLQPPVSPVGAPLGR